MFHVFLTHILPYYHYQQQNMIPNLSYLSSVFFIGLECSEIFRIWKGEVNQSLTVLLKRNS